MLVPLGVHRCNVLSCFTVCCDVLCCMVPCLVVGRCVAVRYVLSCSALSLLRRCGEFRCVALCCVILCLSVLWEPATQHLIGIPFLILLPLPLEGPWEFFAAPPRTYDFFRFWLNVLAKFRCECVCVCVYVGGVVSECERE